MIANSNKGLVTIAIPAYKDKWLAEAIESALNQDYENIELLIVDDHSPLCLKKIVTPYLKDPRVCYYYNEKNLGKESIALNWNRCLELAHGDFFVLLCDDDILDPSFVSSLLSLAKKYPDCNVFHARKAFLEDSTGEIKVEKAWPEFEDFDAFLSAKGIWQRSHTITEFLYRTSVIKSMKFEVFPVGYFSDDATILKMVKKGGVASSDVCLCFFRKSMDHITGNNRYEYGKAKASILYFNWFQKNIKTSLSNKRKSDVLDIWLIDFYNKAVFIDKLRILSLVPHEVWSLKHKVYLFLSIFGLNKLINSISKA